MGGRMLGGARLVKSSTPPPSFKLAWVVREAGAAEQPHVGTWSFATCKFK